MNSDAFCEIVFTHAVWGLAMSRSPDDPITGPLAQLIAEEQDGDGNSSASEKDNEWSTAINTVASAVQDGRLHDPLVHQMLSHAARDGERWVFSNAQDAAQCAEAAMARFAAAQSALDETH